MLLDTHSALTTLVADAVDIVVFSQRTPSGPEVTEVLAVEDLAGNPETGAFTVTDLYDRSGPDRALAWTGNVPMRLGARFASSGEDLLALLHGGEVSR